MKGLEAMRRHLGRANVVKLENDDGTYNEIEIKPLPFECIPEFWSIFQSFADAGLGANEEMDLKTMMKALNKEVIETINSLLLKSLKITYPDADENLLKEFIASNFMELMTAMFEVNMPMPQERTKLEKLKIPKNIKPMRGQV